MTFPTERTTITDLLAAANGTNRPVVLELGAHEGEDTVWLRDYAYVIAVEADRPSYEKLSELINCFTIYGAIADHDGTTEFWRSDASGGGYGSIYEPPHVGINAEYDTFTKVTGVPCFTLDTLVGRLPKLSGKLIDLVWADLHGAERDMIQCGKATLSHTRYLFMEVFEESLYKGMATREELLSLLPDWDVVEKFPWNVLLRNRRILRCPLCLGTFRETEPIECCVGGHWTPHRDGDHTPIGQRVSCCHQYQERLR